jgi:hypothetical protein
LASSSIVPRSRGRRKVSDAGRRIADMLAQPAPEGSFMRQPGIAVACLLAVCLLVSAPGAADARQRLVEGSIGLEGTVSRLGQLEETPFGFTGRFTVDFDRRVSVDVAVVRFPQKVGGNFGERIWLAGARVRVWSGESRLYARARAGRIYFGGSFFEGVFPDRTLSAFDVGATIEDDLTPHFVWRMEVGDLIIPFDGVEYAEAGPPRLLRTTHNLIISTGVALRF